MKDNKWENMVREFAQFYNDSDNDEYSRPDIFILVDDFIERQQVKQTVFEIMEEFGIEQFKEWAEQAEAELITRKVL